MSGYTEDTRSIRESDLIGPTTTSAKYRDLSNMGRSLVLAERVRELVPFKQVGNSWQICGVPSREAVLTIAEEAAHMWPRGMDTAEIFSRSASGHNGLYWGRHFPSGVGRAVARASLYADRIYVINPIIDSFFFHPQQSPLVVPEKWTAVYAANAAFLSALHPWIRAGIVELVPNPAMVNFQLGNALATQARNELIELGPELKEHMKRHFVSSSAESFLYMRDEDRERVISNMGGASPSDRKAIAEEVARLRSLDLQVSEILCQAKANVIATGPGASLPAASLMAKSLSATILADDAMCVDRMRLSKGKDPLPSQLLSDAFQSLEFTFLNDIEADRAAELRQLDGVVRFRRYLQDISGLASISNSSADYTIRVKECADRVTDEYEAYRKEWKGLDHKLAKDAFVATPAFAGVSTVIAGKLDPVVMAGAYFTGLVKSLMDAWTKKKSLSSKPLGLLMKLESGH